MGDELQNLNDADQLADLIRIDPQHICCHQDKRIKPITRQNARIIESVEERDPCKMIILKPRQKGASTCAQALTYHHMRKHENLTGSLMGDISGTSDKVFEIYRRYAENDLFPWDEGIGIIGGWGQSGRFDKAKIKKPLRKRNRRFQKCWSIRNNSGW